MPDLNEMTFCFQEISSMAWLFRLNNQPFCKHGKWNFTEFLFFICLWKMKLILQKTEAIFLCWVTLLYCWILKLKSLQTWFFRRFLPIHKLQSVRWKPRFCWGNELRRLYRFLNVWYFWRLWLKFNAWWLKWGGGYFDPFKQKSFNERF